MDQAIAENLKAFKHTLDSVSGIGPVYAAGIISEIGDVHRFPNDSALAQFTGLTWPKYQSGKFHAEETRMSHAGNQYLRYYLVEAANSVKRCDATYKAFYEKKYAEATKHHHHKRALVLTARKLVRLVWTLLTRQVFPVFSAVGFLCLGAKINVVIFYLDILPHDFSIKNPKLKAN